MPFQVKDMYVCRQIFFYVNKKILTYFLFFFLVKLITLMTGCVDWDIVQWNETAGHGASEKSAHNDSRGPHPTHLHPL